MSFSALLLELGLTRLFSVVLFYHFAFLAISIALLGLGAGAVFAYLRREWLQRWTINELGAALCVANALIILAVLEIVLHSSVSLRLDWGNFGRLTVLYLASAMPFLVTGLLFSTVFARHPGAHHAALWRRFAGRIAGLPGAGSAAQLYRRTKHHTLCCLFGGVGWSCMVHARACAGRRRYLAALLLALIAVNFRGRLIDIVYAKGMKRATPLFAKWNALSRVEVDEQGWAKVDCD